MLFLKKTQKLKPKAGSLPIPSIGIEKTVSCLSSRPENYKDSLSPVFRGSRRVLKGYQELSTSQLMMSP